MIKSSIVSTKVADTEMSRKFSPSDVVALYHNASPFSRLLIAARPSICPMQPLLDAVPDGSSVLDIGCGNGLLLAWLALNNKIVAGLGCDVSLHALEGARSMAQAFRAASGQDLLKFADCREALPGGQYDLVSMVDVMHHIPPSRQREIFVEAVARIKPGGLLLYKDMAARPWWRAWANRLHDLLLARQWIHYAPLTTVKGWAEGAGLALQHEECYARFVYGHELLVFRKAS